MNMTMAIVHPEIIVVENAMKMDTHALILTVSVRILSELYVVESVFVMFLQTCLIC